MGSLVAMNRARYAILANHSAMDGVSSGLRGGVLCRYRYREACQTVYGNENVGIFVSCFRQRPQEINVYDIKRLLGDREVLEQSMLLRFRRLARLARQTSHDVAMYVAFHPLPLKQLAQLLVSLGDADVAGEGLVVRLLEHAFLHRLRYADYQLLEEATATSDFRLQLEG